MEKEAWRDAFDADRVASFLEAEGLGQGGITGEHLLAGGTQNVIVRFQKGGRAFVLRRPASSAGARGDATIRREMQVLAALADTDVPHPRFIAGCEDTAVLGANFYVMEAIEGFNVTVGMPPLHAGRADFRREMGFALIEGIVRLGRIDARVPGLHSLGRPEGFLERQVARWSAQLDSYSEHAGWQGRDVLPGVERVGVWLDRYRPRDFTPGILHGDYHLANVMFRNDGPQLAAIVDWELATIGDPLLDLGWVLTTWPRADDSTSMQIEPWDGFPDSAELQAYYADRSERDLSAMDWYVVLACYKLGILLEGTSARAAAGKADRHLGERFHRRAVALFERALAMIGAEA